MYVNNPEIMKEEELFYCKRAVYEYLTKSGIPLFANKSGFYIFRKTELFQKAFDKMPSYLKVIHRLTAKEGTWEK